jgi:tetratricopeptide (TPR) repeat protein
MVVPHLEMLQPEIASPMRPGTKRINPHLALAGVFLLVSLAYANHFPNSFHFDDYHAIVENPWIRELHNIPHFFADGNTFSTLPPNRSYRPVVSTSLAIDYWLAHGLQPLWFHLTTFFWYLVQLAAMFSLFRHTFDRARPGPRNTLIALFATAVYGVHPAMAETVNYVIQRADLYSALGAVAGLTLYIAYPAKRKYGLYLVPVVLGIFSKVPAAVFPVLLFFWIRLFDSEDAKTAAIRSLPSILVAGAAAAIVLLMNPSTFVAGAGSPWSYRITQPWILLGYFRKFFVPTGFSADTDQVPLSSILGGESLPGLLFVVLLCGAAWWCRRSGELRPISFGLLWFLTASLPTSVIPLAEVENDHRMYFPFVGLALAASWAGALWVEKARVPARILIPACALLLTGFAWGTRQRNEVWRTEETLWKDVTLKSPKNGRGLMNYGLTQMAKGNYAAALDYFNRAQVLDPNYYILEINLGIAYGAMGNAAEAERHLIRAVFLAPDEASTHYYYARWLSGASRTREAIMQLQIATRANPDYMEAHYLSMQLEADAGDAAALKTEAQSVLARFPGDGTALSWLARSGNLTPATAYMPPSSVPADALVAQSLAFFQAGKYNECIDAARQAVKINPRYTQAWNNLGACYNSLSQWDQGIAAEDEALRISPDFQLAKNNRAWALQQKIRATK